MTVLITLTLAQTDTGPFDIYSNADGFTTPFATNVPKGALQAGYLTSAVPDATTYIRCSSIGVCTNYVEMILANPTTTTTTTTEIPCGAVSQSGGTGITERVISLRSTGGIIIFEFNAEGIPDKMEFIHNGVKKATSGMTGANSGPFDNVYGTPPGNVIPDSTQAAATAQFIGSSKGAIPNRNAEFLADTGVSGIVVEAGYQQLVWWKYTPADYAVANSIIVRITGIAGTSWNVKRLCAPVIYKIQACVGGAFYYANITYPYSVGAIVSFDPIGAVITPFIASSCGTIIETMTTGVANAVTNDTYFPVTCVDGGCSSNPPV